MAKLDFSNSYGSSQPKKGSVGFFNLKNDKDKAFVRFMYDTVEELAECAMSYHSVNYRDKNRKVNCLRTGLEPVENCPLCAAGYKLEQKIFIKVLKYELGSDGRYTPVPCIWERPAREYFDTLRTKLELYGSLKNKVFLVTRNGVPNDTHVSYSLDVLDNDTTKFPMLENAFADYSVLGVSIWDKTFDELKEFIETGKFPYVNIGGFETHPVQPTQTVVTPAFVSPAMTPTPVQQIAPQPQVVVQPTPTTAMPSYSWDPKTVSDTLPNFGFGQNNF